ncbi:MAG: multiheme c-type cytochrome [Planctomycetaceae bacterium]|nr:multiheme c-type cytochrome [Planctomycetaceae bacterium]
MTELPVSRRPDADAPRGRAETVTPRLRLWLNLLFVVAAVLGLNSAYLASVTALEWYSRQWGGGLIYETYFSLWMFLLHTALGLLLVIPFLVFAIPHLIRGRTSRNRRAVRVGYALFAAGCVVLLTGILLIRAGGVELKEPLARSLVYWLHVTAPLAAIWLYGLHRLVGPRIRWRTGLAYGGLLALASAGGAGLHAWDPRDPDQPGPTSGEAYFQRSLARTATGKFIPAKSLATDEYCQKCHRDAYAGWFHSAHHFSSFNNPMYLASVRETRAHALKRDGTVQASRWCAGCHDPVPFFSGAFDRPDFDDVRDPTAHAGITCTVCHAITHIHGTRGNAEYTIEEPLHYPFAFSDSPVLRGLSEQLIKARPALHKQTFLKPHHQTSEFCATCHKVHLPGELTGYKEFLRGQNHFDSFDLSGVSGHGARSNYYGMRARENCGACHMPAQPSSDFGAKIFGEERRLSIHNHLFLGANTALPYLRGEDDIVAAHQQFLRGSVRVDVFGLKDGGTLDGPLFAPLRPELPTVVPGRSYLLETVIRTLTLGHHFSQGTVDSNEIWVEVTASSGDRILATSGAMDDEGVVDPGAYFIRNHVIDREGNRIDRRNPQDIYATLYDHQIPPGAAQVVHYRLDLPEDLSAPVKIVVKLHYRKFDAAYMSFVARTAKPGDPPIRDVTRGGFYRNTLPVTTMAEDTVIFPVAGAVGTVPAQTYPIKIDHIYMRRNDYGLGLLRQAENLGQPAAAMAELRQAEEIFLELDQKFGYIDVRLNLARVYLAEGRLAEATAAVAKAVDVAKPMFFTEPVYAPWAVNWISGQIHFQTGRLDEAIRAFEAIRNDRNAEMVRRGFDFSRDDQVLNELGLAYFERAKSRQDAARTDDLRNARDCFEQILQRDAEHSAAHYNLMLLAALLADPVAAAKHRMLFQRYKVDDNARERAASLARMKDPWAARAAEPVAIYPLSPPRGNQP